MSESVIIGDSACPACKERGRDKTGNHLIHFSNGNKACNRCSYKEIVNGGLKVVKNVKLEDLPLMNQEYRGVKASTYKTFGVKCEFDEATGDVDKLYYVYDTWAKVRKLPKEFYAMGKQGEKLYGQGLIKSSTLIIVEGEHDCLSAFQMMMGANPTNPPAVVSPPHGATAAKFISGNIEWIKRHSKVILCFDSDERGQEGAVKIANLLEGKVFTVKMELKDAGEYLEAGREKDFVKAVQEAKKYQPEGIVNGADLWDLVKEPIVKAAVSYPWDGLNRMTYGIRTSEVVTLLAGSGQGKTVVTKELMHHILVNTNESVGVLSLEESVRRSAVGLMSVNANKPLHLVEAETSTLKEAFDNTLGTGRAFFYDSFGSNSIDTIVEMIKYLVVVDGCRYIFLDHISIIVSDQQHSDERKALDECMTKLRMLVQKLDICLFVVSHLRRPQGKGHENGAVVQMSDIRGTQAIAQLSDMVIGLERDSQADDEDVRNTTNVRVVKSRYVGYTGIACSLKYNKDTGRLKEEEHEF